MVAKCSIISLSSDGRPADSSGPVRGHAEVGGHHTRQDFAPRFITDDSGQLNAFRNSS